MATYCRITGKSRGLPKPNYFPLLPPISPADAKRFCRITGKAYGLPSHHYIPVLVSRPRKDKKKSSDKPHLIIAGYRYFFPCLDSDPSLLEILNEKKDASSTPNAQFVYTVKESKCGLVFSSKLEAAVRDGDVRDVMLAKDSETVLLKLKKGINISLDVKEINIDDVGPLYEGEGTASVDLKKKNATRAIREIFESKEESQKVIAKESQAKKSVQRSWKNAEPSNFACPQPAFELWKWGDFEKDTDPLQGIIRPSVAPEFRELDVARLSITLDVHQPQINPSIIALISQIDVEKTYNLEMDLQHLPSIESLPEIASLLSNGIIKNKNFKHPQGICVVKDGVKLLIVGQFAGEQFIPGKTVDTPEGKKFVPGVVIAAQNGFKIIPGMFTPHEGKVEFTAGHILESNGSLAFVPGQILQGEFQSGQTLMTDEGIKFIPGRVIEGKFIPGQVVVSESGRKFYPGEYEKEKAELLKRGFYKEALIEIREGLSEITGKAVVSGLTNLPVVEAVASFSEPEVELNQNFIESLSCLPEDSLDSTFNLEILEKSGLLPDASILPEIVNLMKSGKPKVIENNGVKVKGIEIEVHGQKLFIVGQHIDTPQGVQFIPGQTVVTETGKLFIPGLVLLTEQGVKLLPGVVNENGKKFTPGQIIETHSGNKFIAGQVIDGQFTFGTTVVSPEGIKFTPGAHSASSFIPCKIVMCEHGPEMTSRIPEPVNVNEIQPVNIKPIDVDVQACFPGIIQQPQAVEQTSVDTVQIVAPFKPFMPVMEAKLTEAIQSLPEGDLKKTLEIHVLESELLPLCTDIPEIISLISTGVEKIEAHEGKEVHGVQIVKDGKEFFLVGQKINGQFIPGRTTETSDGFSFTPGIVITTKQGLSLLPGAIFDVQGKPEFILGQITSTNAGEQFVPGQVVDTNEGKKFLPGQTISSDGIKFIPGQIVGERFIPGQIVNTEEKTEFIPGQTILIDGRATFVPGQSMWAENGWEFVPGVSCGSEDDRKFIPGRYMKNGESESFIPGQYTIVDGEQVFTPGISVEGKFVSGVNVKDESGQLHFVQGRVISEGGAHKFIPGATKVQGKRAVFQAAENIDEIKVLNTEELKLEVEHGTNLDGVLGHIVQSSHGVEFFPGSSKCLPKGKVVPGKLIREDGGVKFIPGIVVQGEFVPGQVVMTETGEKFIPGQVIDTNEGPKFVPGKIIKTSLGDKFVPGQTIETEEGPKFLPGQIIETKAGPTFIPGQVIHTDEGGSKFVPGQVVDTSEGPRFVPGRVVDAGDQVIFIPGQIVETVDGLHFIAPDLTGENENSEFTVQGFDISPEELKLIQPKHLLETMETREMAINSRMLRQLSEAGMSVGHQVDTQVPDVNVCTAPAIDAACKLANTLKLDPVTTVKLSEIIGAVVRIGKLGEINGTKEEVCVINGILERVIHCKSSEETYKLICQIIEKEMSSNIVENVDKIYKFLISNESPLKRLNKVHAMKEILNCNISHKELLGKMSVVLSDEDEAVCCALERFSDSEPEIISQIVQRFSDTVGKLDTEREVIETLHRAIVATVRESSEQSILDMLKDTENLDLKTLIVEAIGLAKALDMQDTATSLTAILSDPKCTNILGGDRVTLEILRRLTVMRRLAERRPELLASLKNLHLDPYGARTDPGLKQLVRESAALLVVPEEGLSAQEIPSSLFFSQNSIAMEDFLYKTKRPCNILVIIKNGLQAVIPREAAHSVLTGSVPYVVLDEKGIRHFQPKHVFSALKLPKICTNWFSLYKCEFKDIVTY